MGLVVGIIAIIAIVYFYYKKRPFLASIVGFTLSILSMVLSGSNNPIIVLAVFPLLLSGLLLLQCIIRSVYRQFTTSLKNTRIKKREKIKQNQLAKIEALERTNKIRELEKQTELAIPQTTNTKQDDGYNFAMGVIKAIGIVLIVGFIIRLLPVIFVLILSIL